MKVDKRKIGVVLVGIILFAIAGLLLSNMQQLLESQQLWGYRPLFFYLFAYVGLLLIFYPFDFPKPPPPEDKDITPDAMVRVNSSRALLWSTASGLLLGFGFPGYLPAPFLLLIAFVPLLLLQRELLFSSAVGRKVFFHGFHAFLLYNILATYWVTNTAFAPGLFAVLANALLMCIPWMLFHWTSKSIPSLAYLALPAYWIAFEWGHYHWDLNWPWLTIGNGFSEFPSLIQWYEFTGALGGGLWIWIVNLLIFHRFSARGTDGLWASPAGSPYHSTGKPPGQWQWWAIALIIVPPIWSLYHFSTNEVAASEKIKVVAIQPNFEPHFEKFTASNSATRDTFLFLSQQAMADHPQIDYLIYPETSFDRIDEDDILDSYNIKILTDRLGNKGVKHLVTGYDGYHIFGPDETPTQAVRYIPRRSGDTIKLEALNAAMQLDLDNNVVQTYRKGVFVPGAENFPFKDYLGFALPLVKAVGGSTAGRGTQSNRTPFTSSIANIAPVICYESVFGAFFTGYVKEGAQAAFVMTNDGWWDNTAGHRQHLFISSLRAIETRRAVVRSANMGACAFIDQRGHIESRTEYDQAGYLYGEVALNDEQTFYVRFGDWLPEFLAIISFGLLLLTLFFRLQPPAKRKAKVAFKKKK